MKEPFVIRLSRAAPSQAEELTRLALGAKKYWKYPDAWIEQWRAQLTVSSEYIESNEVYVAENGGRVIGFLGLKLGEVARLEHLWIAPEMIGRGVGQILFRHAVELARRSGQAAIEIDADPNAEGFYLKMGARRVATIRSEVAGTARETPRLAFTLK